MHHQMTLNAAIRATAPTPCTAVGMLDHRSRPASRAAVANNVGSRIEYACNNSRSQCGTFGAVVIRSSSSAGS